MLLQSMSFFTGTRACFSSSPQPSLAPVSTSVTSFLNSFSFCVSPLYPPSYVFMYVASGYACMHMSGSKWKSDVFLSCSLTFVFLKQGLSVNHELPDLSRLYVHWTPGIPLFPHPQCCLADLSYVDSEGWTGIFRLVWQTLSHPSRLLHFLS